MIGYFKELFLNFKNTLRYSKLVYLNPKLIYSIFIHRLDVDKFIKGLAACGYSEVLSRSPIVLRYVREPYIHNDWSVAERFNHILGHYRQLNHIPHYFDITAKASKEVLDLSDYSEDARVVIEHPIWFHREGEAVVTLFKRDLRVMSCAISFGQVALNRAMYIGSVQGIHAYISSEESLAVFRDLTKNFYGLRPRAFIIELVRMLARATGTKYLYAISDKNRHQRHPFFGDYLDNAVSTVDYDDVWIERRGVLLKNGFYSIPLDSRRRDLSEVASKKRGMYRNRYQMLDDLSQKIVNVSTLD